MLPHTVAIGNIHSGIMAGKLNGAMPATTPSGCPQRPQAKTGGGMHRHIHSQDNEQATLAGNVGTHRSRHQELQHRARTVVRADKWHTSAVYTRRQSTNQQEGHDMGASPT